MLRTYSSRPSGQSSTTSRRTSGYFLVVFPATAVLLGFWQVYRRRWKLDLIDNIERRTHKPPIQGLPDTLDRLSELAYRRVRVRGRFDHAREIILAPRMPVQASGGGIISYGGKIGGLVITPFVVEDGSHYDGQSILVNRGWVPTNLLDPAKRSAGQVTEPTVLVGLLRESEKNKAFAPKNSPKSPMWHRRDIDAMAAMCGTLPVYVDADSKSSVPGGPIGGQTNLQIRNEHAAYIVTWWGLAAVSGYLWYRKFVQRRPFR